MTEWDNINSVVFFVERLSSFTGQNVLDYRETYCLRTLEAFFVERTIILCPYILENQLAIGGSTVEMLRSHVMSKRINNNAKSFNYENLF